MIDKSALALAAAGRIVEWYDAHPIDGDPRHDTYVVAKAILSLSEENERLHAYLRSHVIGHPMDDWKRGMCFHCHGEWSDGIERHEPDCPASPKESSNG